MFCQLIVQTSLSSRLGELTYSVPDFLQSKIQIGSIVKVSMRDKKYNAIVINLLENQPSNSRFLSELDKVGKIKDVEQIIYSYPLLSKQQIQLAYHISNYYCCSLYKAICLFLPKKIWDGTHKEERETYFAISPDYDLNIKDFLNKEGKRSKKMADILIEILKHSSTVSQTKLIEQKKYSPQSIKKLIEKGFITTEKGMLIAPNMHSIGTKKEDLHLSEEQKQAIKAIKNSNQNIFLIHGVTGSGKTEIYLELAKEADKENFQTLILVPEISLTPQFIKYFQNEFPDNIAIIHSKLSEGEKCQQWLRIRSNEVKLIIGSRSALFSPFQNLKYLIIDEEHSWTYKQDQSPRYHARDLAIEITKQSLILNTNPLILNTNPLSLILGSATPSIESYQAAQKGDFELIELHNRINNTKLPKTHIVDLRNELKSGNFSIFSNLLQAKLIETFQNKKQSILFLNRRGSASSVICRDCGYSPKCKVCITPLTYHEVKTNSLQLKAKSYLQCHYCNLIQNMEALCTNCQSPKIKFVGIGTEKIELEIKKLLPVAKVARADSDTITNKNAFRKIYEAMKNHEIDVLVGTQMISKGLHLPKVTLVGIVLADLGINIPDFRAQEKTFQLITQVAGRCGRADNKGEVVIQTYCPENFAINVAAKHDYKAFFSEEIKTRKALNYPPFGSITKLIYSNTDKYACEKESQRIYDQIRNLNQKDISSYLTEPIYPRLHGRYHYHIWMKGDKTVLQKILQHLGLQDGWRIDVDPINI